MIFYIVKYEREIHSLYACPIQHINFYIFQIPIEEKMLEFLIDKFSCDNQSSFPGMANYENMIHYFSELRKMSEKSQNSSQNESIFGGPEHAEHEFVTRLNSRKEKMVKKASAKHQSGFKNERLLKQEAKYDSDSSVPSSFRTDR